MNIYNINETHIIVIRKDAATGLLKTEYLPLEYEDQSKLDELMVLSKQKGVTGEVLYNATIEKGLGYLLEYYDFCRYVNGSYQCCPYIGIDSVKEGCLYSDSKLLYEQILFRRLPYCLSKKYQECKQDPSIVAYSTRYIGWSSMKFKLNEDLIVTYHTNFGYGWANYFIANLKYKDIDILPYSMWIHYYKVNINEILRYTRSYHINNQEWEPALEFGCEVCNSLIQSPCDFANKWLVCEVKKMVDGLKNIFNDYNSVIAVNESSGSRINLETKEEITLYKGEKISGALSFIDKIRTIEKLNISMDGYIDTILDLNHQMVPELMDAIDTIRIQLIDLEKKRERIEKEIFPIRLFVENHIDECSINFLGNTDCYSKKISEEIMSGISQNFKNKKKRADELETQLSRLVDRIGYLNRVSSTLKGYVDTINKFMKKEEDIAA